MVFSFQKQKGMLELCFEYQKILFASFTYELGVVSQTAAIWDLMKAHEILDMNMIFYNI